jgi:hypothetical protein
LLRSRPIKTTCRLGRLQRVEICQKISFWAVSSLGPVASFGPTPFPFLMGSEDPTFGGPVAVTGGVGQ